MSSQKLLKTRLRINTNNNYFLSIEAYGLNLGGGSQRFFLLIGVHVFQTKFNCVLLKSSLGVWGVLSNHMPCPLHHLTPPEASPVCAYHPASVVLRSRKQTKSICTVTKRIRTIFLLFLDLTKSSKSF
jgi:hypothetical protein